MKAKFYKSVILIIAMSSATSAYSLQSKNISVEANILKKNGFVDSQTGYVEIDLNEDGYPDIIEYTYINETPPGTCDQTDCTSSLDSSAMLTFQIKMSGGKVIDGSYICASLEILKTAHNGMKNIKCGPSYILRWNGQEYDTE